MSVKVPEGYRSLLDIRQTEIAIKKVKDFFERDLAIQLDLTCADDVVDSDGNRSVLADNSVNIGRCYFNGETLPNGRSQQEAEDTSNQQEYEQLEDEGQIENAANQTCEGTGSDPQRHPNYRSFLNEEECSQRSKQSECPTDDW